MGGQMDNDTDFLVLVFAVATAAVLLNYLVMGHL